MYFLPNILTIPANNKIEFNYKKNYKGNKFVYF